MVDDKAAKKAARAEKRAVRQERKAAQAASLEAEGVGGGETEGPLAPGLRLPSSLTARQRAAVHEAAEAAGIRHESHGDGDARVLVLGTPSSDADEVAEAPLTDSQLAELLQRRLGLAVPALASPGAPAAPKARARRGGAERPFARRVGAPRGDSRPLSVDGFVAATAAQLELERAAEIEQASTILNTYSPAGAQAKGHSLLKLVCTDIEGGLLGKTLITLVSSRGVTPGTEPLPQHKFTPHDVVALRESKATAGGGEAKPLLEGIVYRVTDTSLVIAVDDVPDDVELFQQPLRLDKLANQVTYDRMKDTLNVLISSEGQQAGRPLLDVMFGVRPPKFATSVPAWTAFNSGLDSSQKAAVDLALAAHDVALIHGPPGTGKTTALVEAILQEVARGNRVLACAASNIAVDNLVERVARMQPKLKVVRVGHPARLLPEVLNNSLEAHVMRSDNSSLASDCRAEIKALNRRLLKLTRKDRAERREIQSELRTLYKEERQRQQRAVYEVLDGAHVICCTLTGVAAHNLRRQAFDVVYIDEAAQALEVACWGAMLRARRVILAGDHLQLPPTILSDAAAKQGLCVTLFERLHAMYGEDVSQMLTVQYRMHDDIMRWASHELYGDRLTAHASVAQHRVSHLPHVVREQEDGEDGSEDWPPLLLFDTAGCDMDEVVEEEGGSRYNQGEAACAVTLIKSYLARGLRSSDLGIITPYSAQACRIKAALAADALRDVEVSTVDGFQGREKEVVVISMVRSNATGAVGFLADRRRMNVAVTRARRQCVLLCNSETVARDAFLATLVAHFEESGVYRSADELAAA